MSGTLCVAAVVTRARLMQSRAYVARVSGAWGARCAPLSAPVGVLVEINLHVQRNRCALSYNSERATRAPAFWLSLLVCGTLSFFLRLFLCRLFLSLSAGYQRLSLRLSLCTFSLSLCVSLPPRLSLRLRHSRSACRHDLRVCHHLSLRLYLSSFRPRLHWHSRQKSATTWSPVITSLAAIYTCGHHLHVWPQASARDFTTSRCVLVATINTPVRNYIS